MAIALLLPIKAHVLPTISCFSPSTRLRILPSIQQTKYSLTHSTPPPSSIARGLSLSRSQAAESGERKESRSESPFCLSVMLSTHNDRFIAPFKRDSAAEERAIEPDDSSSRSIFGDSATASNSGCNSRESIAPVSDSLHPQRQTQRTKLEHLGFLITLSTHVFCLQILVPPSPEYVSPICDLHTGRGRD